MKHPLIRYAVDYLSVGLVLGLLGLSLLPIYVPLSPLALTATVGLLIFFKPIASLIQHNHVHYAIFNHQPANIAFDLLLTFIAGHTCAEWTLHHNIGHHGNAINSLADTSSVRHPKSGADYTKWQYILTGSLKIYPDCCHMAWAFYRQGKPRYLITLMYESFFLIAMHGYFLSVNFTMAFWFLLVANVVNRALVWLGAYWQHLDVPATHAYDTTNMYAGPIFNTISLNIGYHIAHHDQPTLHWSRLKARTEVILPRIPAAHILEKLP